MTNIKKGNQLKNIINQQIMRTHGILVNDQV